MRTGSSQLNGDLAHVLVLGVGDLDLSDFTSTEEVAMAALQKEKNILAKALAAKKDQALS